MMKKHPYFVWAVIGFLLCLSNVARGQHRLPNPHAVVKRMIAQYRSVSSYQDVGIVRVFSGNPLLIAGTEGDFFQNVSLQGDILVSFKTYYTRPEMFRFEWTSSFLNSSRNAAIWSNGKQTYRWIPTIFSRDDSFTLFSGANLNYYASESMASSGGAIYFVPTLLIKDASYFPSADMLSVMTNLSLLGEEQSDGEMCYVIKGNISGIPWLLWISKESYLLRKTRTLYTGGSFSQKETGKTLIAEEIHRDIRINKRIPKQIFTRKPKFLEHDVDLTR